MLINGIDISSLGVKLYDRILQTNSIDTVDDWLDGDIQPTNIRQQEKFRNIKLSFLVLGTNEQDAFYRISKLTQMLKKASIVFDDINLVFEVSILGSADTKRLKNGNFIVSYNLHSDYAKSNDREIYTTNSNFTNAFKLTVLYYQNSTQLLSTDTITIRASSFSSGNATLRDIGVDVDKYQPDYYNHGIATNLNGLELTYANLQYLNTLIINYEPIAYNLTLKYMLGDNDNYFTEFLNETITFTYPQLERIETIGQLVNPQRYKPEGYRATITFQGDLTIENILAQSPMSVLYTRLIDARTKNVLVNYYQEGDEGNWVPITTGILNVKETQFYDGYTLENLIDVSVYRPNQIHYNEGYILDHNKTELIDYDTIEASYDIRYPRSTNYIFVEYYAGVYPNWYRITTSTITTKYKDSYEQNFDLSLLNLDLNRYHTSEYEVGRIYNTASLETYDNVVNAGVIQIYYVPIDYTITVKFQMDDETPTSETFTINALQFFNEPILNDLIPIGDYKPNNYQLDLEGSYSGPITLSALTQASPILIHFVQIHADRTKNILIHYKQELSTIFSTINTSLITINESDCVGGVRLKDLINLNAYKPEYYENGLLDGQSSTALLTYDNLLSEYNVLYSASIYSTPIKYYIDSIDERHWISSSSINYRIIDFETTTTLYDLGLNLNAHKPSYCDDGELQYNGPINFGALRNLESIDIIYPTIESITPSEGEDDGIDYPHRFLFLQHNDLGNYESLHPEWTMNHAYINTGVTAQDMSKLTIVMECKRVDENVPLHDVNGAYGYLFGSSSGQGSFFMRFNNQTQYHNGELTGINTYEAKAGLYTNQLTITETNAIGWSENSGIYASARDGYSNATFTYTNPLQTEHARMPYPLYLFANNNVGLYEYGLAGIGIYGCRIYYDNALIRDMIPVQYYDKIGNLVAPSNCLYDKVSKTFFEDATGLNSFNIIDDDRYEDTNPEHKIGFCYVNYYQGDARFRTVKYSFRASEFIDQEYDLYTAWQVDANQPNFYKPGVIQNYNSIDRSFNGLNTRTFDVVYEEDENYIIVNYYKDDLIHEPELLQTDVISLAQKDFYQVPTFGDIVRLNKYKPEGYKTDYEFPEPKVSLVRVLSHSPYTITYTPETEQLIDYTTTIRYIKKIYGVRTYETIGEITLHFNQTDFRDGEYIDFYIDKDAMKPEKYYANGENYQWYEMDERLTTPEDLKELYVIKYDSVPQYLDVNYYTDDWDEANLIASTTWSFKIDDFDPEYPFYLVDQLPNTYINKYRPANCDGGVLQNSNIALTFDTLVELDEIAIIYESREEPNDPTEAYYEKKVLYWGDLCNRLYPSIKEIPNGINNGTVIEPWRIPYIDLGYRPKEIGRLRVEFTGATKPIGVNSPISAYSAFGSDFTTIFGYWGAPEFTAIDSKNYRQVFAIPGLTADEYITANASYSGASKGCFAIQTRLPSTEGANWIYTYNGPSSIDGYKYTDNVMAGNNVVGYVYWAKPGIIAHFRRGFNYDTDDNYNTIEVFKDYRFTKQFNMTTVPDKETDGYMQVNGARFQAVGLNSYDDTIPREGQDGTWVGDYGFANPFTVILDAYNNYCSIWNYHDSNYPFVWQINDTDNPIWEDIEQPRGSLSLFTATNPTTGKPNFLDDIYWSYPSLGNISGSYGLAFAQSAIGINPYDADTDDHYGAIEYTVESIISNPSDGSAPIVQTQTQTRNVAFADWMTPTFPWLAGGIVWSIKIYDQDRLVRDLIPVAKNDVIYDYVMPDDGLFDLVTEIFFGDSNPGKITKHTGETITYEPAKLYVIPDILNYGKITTNYYDYDNTFIANKFVDVPTWFCGQNTTIEDILEWNDYKPDDYHLDGWIDVDQDWSWWGNKMNLAQIYEMGAVNIYYRLRTFTKTVVYYKSNCRVGSRDLMYSLDDIKNATTLADLGIDTDLYYDPQFQHGKVIFNNEILADDDIEAFINAPSPVVVYEPLTQQEAPHLLYIEYFRGGAYDNNLVIDSRDQNYLKTTTNTIEARVLNPHGAIMYYNHYHQALYEDEDFGEFIPYQVKILNKYSGLHYGPGRKYKTLAMVIVPDTYTIIQERNGWGRLREYPNAWILLSATEPITGPGQNPAYDVADSTVQTVPYGAYVQINRLTIDKLWAYCPSLGSWLKTEDLSLSQRGKQFEGLKIEVINLNDLTFTSGATLLDLDIDIQKWRLYFHNAGYISGGNPTVSYWGLSSRHIMEVVYPETIYTYSCIYYDTKVDEHFICGTAGFSCSLTDWNPDWDTFIDTSWQKEELEGSGTAATHAGGTQSQYTAVPIYSEPVMDNNLHIGNIYNRQPLALLSLAFESGSLTWIKVRGPNANGNGEITGYADASFVNITENYGGSIDIMPTLYRDTVLTLTWDYFGFERDKFRPEGRGPGIYLWSPRTWDQDTIKFSFEELVRCGTQKVLYPSYDPTVYKILIQSNYLNEEYQFGNSTQGYFIEYLHSPGIKIELGSDHYNNRYNFKSGQHFDVYANFEWRNDLGSSSYGSMYGSYFYLRPAKNYRYGFRMDGIAEVSPTNPYDRGFRGISLPFSYQLDFYEPMPDKIRNLSNGDRVIVNWSNYRYSPSHVLGAGNYYNDVPPTYYAIGLNGDQPEITDSLNLSNYPANYTFLDDSYPGDTPLGKTNASLKWSWCLGVIYNIICYEDFNVIHYYVPIPQGLEYTYGYYTSTAECNGLLDLITGEVYRGYRAGDWNANNIWLSDHYPYPAPPPAGFSGNYGDGIEWIFLRDEFDLTQRNQFRYFDTLSYESYTVGPYYRKVNINLLDMTIAPNVYAQHIRTLTPGLIVPIYKRYRNPPGEGMIWWQVADGWIQQPVNVDDFELVTASPGGQSYNTWITPYETTICLVSSRPTIYVYQDPLEVYDINTRSNYSYSVPSFIKIYAKCESSVGNMLFDGAHWIPEAHTSNNKIEVNRNYVITRTTHYFSYPINDNQYRLGNYAYGERVLVINVLAQDENWAQTSEGWIQLLGNTSEVL